MKNIYLLLSVGCLSSVFITGCCNILGVNVCPTTSSLPTAVIEAATLVGGTTAPWVGGIVVANAVADGTGPGGYTCIVDSSGCSLTSTGKTDSLGNYPIKSDAIPGDWQVGIKPDANCLQGAATTVLYLGTSTTSDPTMVVCGDIASGSATANPASCIETLNNSTGVMTSNCPSTITLTIATDSLPTAHALNVSDYSDTGNQYYGFTGSASNTTTIVVPTPNVIGQSVLVIYDPQTNVPLGAALFTLNQVVFTPCGTKRNC